MIVPEYWAEARRQQRVGEKQITVRRHGWSTTSLAEATTMAEARADEALRRIASGEKLERRERKVAYNGAEGVPIREEVLARHGEEVISRNAYGAQCLNSPRALFADVDFNDSLTLRQYGIAAAILLLISALTGWWLASVKLAVLFAVVSLFLSAPLVGVFKQVSVALRGGAQAVARKRLSDFVASRPDWNVRVYATPAGLRVLATHRAFDPLEPEVDAFFRSIGADALYVRMCKNQRCFRARLTAKPWRIGINDHLRPRPGVWPVAADKRDRRDAWIAQYEAQAGQYASCRFLESVGSGRVAAELAAVIELHDAACRALRHELRLA